MVYTHNPRCARCPNPLQRTNQYNGNYCPECREVWRARWFP